MFLRVRVIYSPEAVFNVQSINKSMFNMMTRVGQSIIDALSRIFNYELFWQTLQLQFFGWKTGKIIWSIQPKQYRLIQGQNYASWKRMKLSLCSKEERYLPTNCWLLRGNELKRWSRISMRCQPPVGIVQPSAVEALDTSLSDTPGWLAGLPLGIKDLTVVKGVRTTWGTKGHKSFVPKVSDPLVERIETHGGLVVGKTNTPEYGAGGNTFNDVFGPTLNPWNTKLNAGGSSGGAAASLATGETLAKSRVGSWRFVANSGSLLRYRRFEAIPGSRRWLFTRSGLYDRRCARSNGPFGHRLRVVFRYYVWIQPAVSNLLSRLPKHPI